MASKYTVVTVTLVVLVCWSCVVKGQDDEDELKIKEVAEKLRNLTLPLKNWKTPEEIRRNFTYFLSGFGFDQQPVWVVEFGKWDVRSIVEGGGENLREFDNYINQAINRLFTSPEVFISPTVGEEVPSNFVVLVDFEGYSLLQLNSIPTISFILNKARYLHDAMKRLDVGLCVNVNYIAQTLLEILRPILGRDFERLEIFGTNKQRWLPRVKQTIPRDQIPAWYGGKQDFKPYAVFG